MARILKARYFPDCTILEAVQKKKASYAWKSILYGKELITQGMRYVIGDGSYANMWSDPWIPDHPPRPPRCRDNVEVTNCKVRDFFRIDRNEWDVDKLREMVIDEDVNKILRLKISPTAQQDLMGWHYNDDGLYTVKSGYWLASHLPQQRQIQPTYGDVGLKQRIWKTNTPQKIKHFVWKLLTKSLPTGENLRRRHVTQQAQCQRCGSADETEHHLFFTCQYAQCVWRASGISNTIITSSTTTLEEKIEACLQFSTSTRLSHFQELPWWILWRLWKSRNLMVFQRRGSHWLKVIKYAKLDAQEWQEAEKMQDGFLLTNRSSHGSMKHQWRRAPTGWIKCNYVDGSFYGENIPSNAGWIVRDEEGIYKGAVQAKGKKVGSSLESELQAILMAIQFCWGKGYRRLIIEGDSQKAIQLLNYQKKHFGLYNWIREIKWWERRFDEVQYHWVGREANQVADKLAKECERIQDMFSFHYYVPLMINNLLHEDYVNSSSP